MEIVDAHQHLGSIDHCLSHFGETRAEPPDGEDAVRRSSALGAAGIDWAVIQPSHGYLLPDGIKDTMRINNRMAAYRNLDPQRFRAVVGTVEPRSGERALDEITRAKTELALDGLSWHHRFQGCYIDSQWMWPILRRMSELDMVAVFHTNAESSLEAPWRLQRLAKEFPQMNFVAHDGLWTYERAVHILSTAHETPNVIWDLGGPASYVPIEKWVELNGSTTACFSANFSYTGSAAHKPQLLDLIENAKIAAEDKANILGKNLSRVFKVRSKQTANDGKIK
ncbi:MAG TPA: amidohydrolase family protein [Burkholderiales bacterium]|nr:amidohydrolase family protein [Burkholderiales bacterium]